MCACACTHAHAHTHTSISEPEDNGWKLSLRSILARAPMLYNSPFLFINIIFHKVYEVIEHLTTMWTAGWLKAAGLLLISDSTHTHTHTPERERERAGESERGRSWDSGCSLVTSRIWTVTFNVGTLLQVSIPAGLIKSIQVSAHVHWLMPSDILRYIVCQILTHAFVTHTSRNTTVFWAVF